MLTLYHAPESRSSRVLWLLHELGAPFDIVRVDIPRQDGSGARDPRNPHPEGKVPALAHAGRLVVETGAVMLYLTDLFPDRRLGVAAGEPERGPYLTWLFWYGGVMEPVYVAEVVGVADHPVVRATVRGRAEVEARLIAALEAGPWLVGGRFTAADILLCSPYLCFPDAVPEHDGVRDWIARCTARPAYAASLAAD